MARITKYCTIEASSQSKLADRVRSAIERGWEPIGGVAISYRDDRRSSYDRATYVQAMVKKRRWFQ